MRRGRMASAPWDRLRRRCLDRDNWRCQQCGKYGHHAHHRIPVHERPDLEDDPSNIVTLCRSCHEAHHADERRRPNPERDAWRALLRSA